MQYLLALAYQKQAETLKPGDKQRPKYEAEARRLAGQVVKQKSDVQNDARLLLGKLGRPADAAADAAGAKTFDEAFEKATAAITELAAKVAADKHSQSAESDNAQAVRLAGQLADALGSAYRAVERALALADDKIDPAKLNTARYYLCYLHWEYAQSEAAKGASSSHYFDAAVLGDFLARRFPDHANARQAMAIALASYQKIRQDEMARAVPAAQKADQSGNDARQADASLAVWSSKITGLAEFAIDRWPDSDEAASATAVLASVAVERQEIDAALKLIEKLKPDTARRADTELRVGRAIWAQYQRAKKDLDQRERGTSTPGGTGTPDGTDKPGLSVAANPVLVDRKTLDLWASHAQALLERGLATVKKKNAEIDRTFVLAQLALVQSYVNTSQPEKAIAWLEEDKIGLVALVADKHEAAEIEGLMFDVYRLALRAYIAVKPQQLDKALATMNALEKITGDDAKGRETLTAVYIATSRWAATCSKRLTSSRRPATRPKWPPSPPRSRRSSSALSDAKAGIPLIRSSGLATPMSSWLRVWLRRLRPRPLGPPRTSAAASITSRQSPPSRRSSSATRPTAASCRTSICRWSR
jgi:hypothetical protein